MPQKLLPQEAVQFTPASVESPDTVATNCWLVLAFMLRGCDGLIETEMVGTASIVIVADTDLLLLVSDVAVTVTVLPDGIAEGAVNCVAVPLEVEDGLKAPHAELAQLTVHVTPFVWGSLVTVAAMLVFPPVFMDVGGPEFGVNATESAGGVAGVMAPQPANINERVDIQIKRAKR